LNPLPRSLCWFDWFDWFAFLNFSRHLVSFCIILSFCFGLKRLAIRFKLWQTGALGPRLDKKWWKPFQCGAMWMLGGPAQDAAKKAWAEFYFKIKFGVVYCTAISLLPYVLRWCGVGALKDE